MKQLGYVYEAKADECCSLLQVSFHNAVLTPIRAGSNGQVLSAHSLSIAHFIFSLFRMPDEFAGLRRRELSLE